MRHSKFSCATLNNAYPDRHLVHTPRPRSALIRRSRESTFMSQPDNEARWIKSRRTRLQPRSKRSPFTARLTIDVTPDLRARIKIAAFERGVTVAYMLRLLLLKAFPRTKGRRR
jgi:hypothetical protein